MMKAAGSTNAQALSGARLVIIRLGLGAASGFWGMMLLEKQRKKWQNYNVRLADLRKA